MKKSQLKKQVFQNDRIGTKMHFSSFSKIKKFFKICLSKNRLVSRIALNWKKSVKAFYAKIIKMRTP